MLDVLLAVFCSRIRRTLNPKRSCNTIFSVGFGLVRPGPPEIFLAYQNPGRGWGLLHIMMCMWGGGGAIGRNYRFRVEG